MHEPQIIAPTLATLYLKDYCYLTTKGRKTRRLHEIEIWFGVQDETIYLLSGGGLVSDWVRNLIASPNVQVRIGNQIFSGDARLVTESGEEKLARELLAAKYYRWKEGKTLNNWARTATPVAIKLSVK